MPNIERSSTFLNGMRVALAGSDHGMAAPYDARRITRLIGVITLLRLISNRSVRQNARFTAGEKLMHLIRNGTQASAKGPADYFTGHVRIDPLFNAPEPARVGCASVTFEPGARSAWHIHPLGQILIVTVGCGWTQCEGGQVEVIRAGDVIWCPPGHRHWHGATPTTAMTHIAVQEYLDGKAVEWMEHVTDEQYLAGQGAS
jgi:quercetin dioxygenase-like cupin family protein